MLEKFLKNNFDSKKLLKDFVRRMIQSKKIKVPPNILIFTEDEREFKNAKVYFQSILGKNSYTIYRLNSIDLLENSSIWISSCALLITFESINETSQSGKYESFLNYLKSGGKILSVPSVANDLSREELKLENSYNLFYFGQKFGFESLYENNFQLFKQSWHLSQNNFKNLFYYFTNPSHLNGVHFLCKVFRIFLNIFNMKLLIILLLLLLNSRLLLISMKKSQILFLEKL